VSCDEWPEEARSYPIQMKVSQGGITCIISVPHGGVTGHVDRISAAIRATSVAHEHRESRHAIISAVLNYEFTSDEASNGVIAREPSNCRCDSVARLPDMAE